MEKTHVAADGVDLPYEARKTAVCGNLGEATDAGTVEARCSSILKEAGIPDKSILCIAATCATRCNMCEVAFDEPESLKLAWMRVRALRKELLNDKEKPVWLDAKKTRVETRRPNKMVHRAHDHLASGIPGRSTPPELEKDLANKLLKANHVVIGYASQADWSWTSDALRFFSQQELDMARAYSMPQ